MRVLKRVMYPSPRCVIALLLVTIAHCRVIAQGTLRFGFEEYSVGQTPSFVTIAPVQVGPGAFANVTEAASSGLPALEGRKVLSTYGDVLITPPNGELIQSFSIALYVRSLGGLSYGVDGVKGDPNVFGRWQVLSGSIDPPAATLKFGAALRGGVTFPWFMFVDDVVLTTVAPEPGTISLALLGGAAFLVVQGRWRRR